MTLTRRDLTATVFTALAVLVFAATHQGWSVWLVGGSHRWAAGAIMLLGMGACAQGSPGKDAATWFLATLGVVALALGVVALVTGSLTALSFLALDVVVLWGVSLLRHASHGAPMPVST